MQIKRLKIQNIASLANVEIDFATPPLSDAPIFLICGDTGAGKSTILDALCLALYGKTPRMASVAKEQIFPDMEENDRLYSNDNAQLLRRGTGWGEICLIFTGNDGKDYMAVWAVQRDYKKPEYKLQREARRLLESLDGCYSENKKAPIEEKIVELTGMDYNQFCRTVMLAQGEFTKFLKSNGREKAEILEKLTGTEIYSVIGRKIAEKNAMHREEWERLSLQIKNISLMSEEELAATKDKISKDTSEIETLSEQKKEKSEILNWIRGKQKLIADEAKVAEVLNRLRLEVSSAEFVARKQLVKDFRSTEMVRHLIKEQDKLQSGIAKIDLLIPEIKKSCEVAKSEAEVADKNYSDHTMLVENQTRLYEAFDVKKLNKFLNDSNDKYQKLNNIVAIINECKLQTKMRSDILAEMADKELAIENAQRVIEDLEKPLKDALEKLAACDEVLSKLTLSMNDVVKEMRHDLQVGDMCPVCGAKIVEKLEDSYFESVLAPLREDKKAAEDSLNDIRSKKLAEEKLLKNLNGEMRKLRKKEEKCTSEIKNSYGSFAAAWIGLGYGECSLTEAEECAAKELQILEIQIAEAREKQKEAEEINGLLKKLRKEERHLKKECDVKKENYEKFLLALERSETDRKINAERLASVAAEIEKFYNSNPDISAQRVGELMLCDEEVIKDGEKEITQTEAEHTQRQGAYELLKNQINELEERRPEMGNDDTEEKLSAEIQKIEVLLQSLNREVGTLTQKLSTDDADRKRVSKVRGEMEKIRPSKDNWESLNRMLGDKDGSRFRSVAQSFILKGLLENANRYMRCFTDRYTLTCNPGALTILVADCYKPGDPQPASILSGGESFMASLSLALGLSGLRGGGMGVDIIFIDEGFGSLSSECLGNVMDTLERLHQIGGRRVGLISHVAEMKERIPVQIHVQRESPALSRVEVKEMD